MTNKEKYKQAFSFLHTSDISEGAVSYTHLTLPTKLEV